MATPLKTKTNNVTQIRATGRVGAHIALLNEREKLRSTIKDLEEAVRSIDEQLLPHVEKEGDSAIIGDYRVLVVRQKMSKFDFDGYQKYLVEKGVRPTLLSAARKRNTSESDKKPYLKVTKEKEKSDA